ncbi:MAG: dethiobiotin synthase [Cyanobacteria bacterium P01_D01_bin.123]
MATGIFISGTDTDVGKTIVSSMLCRLLSQQGCRVAYFKPVQSGAIAGSNTTDISSATTLISPDVETVRRIAPEVETACGYLLELPAAPQLAAELAEPPVRIEFERLDLQYQELRSRHDVVVVEGAGGLAVPLAPDLSTLDLMQKWQLPLVLVSRPNLGTINHTVLSVVYARDRGLDLLATIISYGSPALDPDNPICATAPRFIAQLSDFKPEYLLPWWNWQQPASSAFWKTLADRFAPLLEQIIGKSSLAG